MSVVVHECRICGEPKPWPDEFRSDKGSFTRCKECAREYQREWNATHREQTRKWARDYRTRRKQRVMDHYGGKCECCGETGLEFLTIDHVERDGKEHRDALGGRNNSGVHMHWWLEKNNYPDGFRVLCYNCNFASYWNGGVCPHKEESP